jgi:hypothetical protein
VARRERCGIPTDLGHMEKWQLALDMIDETRTRGIDVPLVIADAGYRDAGAFRLGLNQRGLSYMVGISRYAHRSPGRSTAGHLALQRHRPPPVARYPEAARSVKALVIAAGRNAARPVSWHEDLRPGKGRTGFKRVYSRFVALRMRPAGREIREATKGAELPACWPWAWLTSRAAPSPLAPLRHPHLPRPRLLHPAPPGHRPQSRGAGLSLYQVVREPQLLLVTWAGACPTCHRDLPTRIHA